MKILDIYHEDQSPLESFDPPCWLGQKPRFLVKTRTSRDMSMLLYVNIVKLIYEVKLVSQVKIESGQNSETSECYDVASTG